VQISSSGSPSREGGWQTLDSVISESQMVTYWHESEIIKSKFEEQVISAAPMLIDSILILLKQAFDVDCPDAARDLQQNMHKILNFLYDHDSNLQKLVVEWANQITTGILVAEMSHLASKDAGFHFQANKTTESKLKEFNIPEMAMTMQHAGPVVWKLFSKLLEADPNVNYKRDWARKKAKAAGVVRQRSGNIQVDEDIEMEDITQINTQDSDYWNTYDREELPLVDDDDDEPEGLADQLQDQFTKLKTIVGIFFVHYAIKLKDFFRSRLYVSA
jgi:hypothetical protein